MTLAVRSSGWAPPFLTIFLLTAAGIVVNGQMYSVLALFDTMSESFGVRPEDIAITTSAFGAAYAVSVLIAGPLSDRFGPRIVITGGLLASALTSVLVAQAWNLNSAILFRILQGVSTAYIMPSVFHYVNKHIDQRLRGVALTVIASGGLSAAIIFQVAAQLISSTFDWQAVFYCSAVLALMFAVACWLVLRPAVPGRAVRFAAALAAIPRLVRQPRLLALYFAATMLLGSFVAIYAAISLAGPSSVASEPDALLILRASAFPAMLLVPFLTPFFSRLTPLLRIRFALLAAIICLIWISAFRDQLLALNVLLFAFAVAILACAPAILEEIGGTAPENPGAATSLYVFSIFLGGSIGPLIVSWLVGDFGFRGVILVVAALVGLGLIAILFVRPRSSGGT